MYNKYLEKNTNPHGIRISQDNRYIQVATLFGNLNMPILKEIGKFKFSDTYMINCSQCKEEISDEARVCPKCGQPQFYASTYANAIVMFIMSFLFANATMHVIHIELQKIDVFSGIFALVVTTYGYNKRKN